MKTLLKGAVACATFLLACAALTGCDSEKGRSEVRGVIKGAEGQKVYMEAIGLTAQTTLCDSQVVASDGEFSLRGQLQTEPTFYNIRLADGRSFSVVLDSAETITLTADAGAGSLVGNVKFDNSEANADLQDVMSAASGLLAKLQDGTATDSLIRDVKDQMTGKVFANPRSMVGYYIVFQKIGGLPLFDVMNKRDHQLFSAVATSLQMAYPRSEQVKYLCDYVLGARAARKANARRDSLIQQAKPLNSPDLTLPDKDGKQRTLSSLRGKTVILFFWMAANDDARQAQAQLASIYKKYKGSGLEIYSVSFDTSKVLWEAATTGEEWVNVCDLKGVSSPAAATYNVTSIPSDYILAPDGRLIGKDLFGTRLDNKLKEILR